MPVMNLSDMQRGHRRFLEANHRLVARVAESASKAALDAQQNKAQFKRRTGKAAAGARAKVVRLRSGRRVRIYNVAKHAKYLELGTRPHTITARRKRALSFMWHGVRVVTRRVRHPGTRPYHFIRTSAVLAKRTAKHALNSGMQAIARQF